MQTIEDIKQAFLEYAQTETNIVGALPAKREDAVALIEYMKDKCDSIAFWDNDSWWEFKWDKGIDGENGHEEGWQSNEDWTCHTTEYLAGYDFTRVKFLGVKPKEQWT